MRDSEGAMAETRIGVIGCAGRVGRMLIGDIVATEGCVLAGGVARPAAARSARISASWPGSAGSALPPATTRSVC